MMLKSSLHNITQKWSDKEFKVTLLKLLGVYIAALFFERLINLVVIGTLGNFVSLALLILFGRTIYQNRSSLRKRAIRSFWFFTGLFIFIGLFGQDLFGILIPDIQMALGLVFVLNTLIWVIFFLFWSQEQSLPARALAYMTALSAYAILMGLFGIITLLSLR